MERHPAPHAHAERRDLVFGHRPVPRGGLVRPADPDADAVLAPFRADVERFQGVDQPALQRADIGAYIRAPPPSIRFAVEPAAHAAHELAPQRLA